jgi:hypothetical protein
MATTDLTKLKPRQVEAYFRDLILKTFGNKTEDGADITSHSGSYYITFDDAEGVHYAFGFKKRNAKSVARAIRGIGRK